MFVVPSLVISASVIVKTPIESKSAFMLFAFKSATKLPTVLAEVIVIEWFPAVSVTVIVPAFTPKSLISVPVVAAE